MVASRADSRDSPGPPRPTALPPPSPPVPQQVPPDPLDVSGMLALSVDSPPSEPPPMPLPLCEPPVPPAAEIPFQMQGCSKRNTSDSPHVRAALQRISSGEATVAEASIQYDIPIPTLYLNMRRTGVKARGRVGMAGKRKPRGAAMSVEMRSALDEIGAGTITASKASRKYNITLPRIMSWMRKLGVRSAYARNNTAAPPEMRPGPEAESPAI
ncbi:verprolin-like [Pollicipes pollicipes]|uniref:verprolin-like n=1 Tax=Pollicipes pollicipes TaxID=41117 RepID=UPI00188516D1|nr:verprolin-like [Pollicipes pollicipes]